MRETARRIEFEEAGHAYRVDGRQVPGVTAILRSAGLIDTSFFSDDAAWRGTAIHKALQYLDEGDLDEEGLDQTIAGYLLAWKKFRAEASPEIREIEKPVYNDLLGYAGTPDRTILLNGRLGVLDFKTGGPAAWHQIQTAGYKACLDPAFARWALYLRQDGTYSLVEHRNPSDLNVFLSCLAIHEFKKGKA